MEREIFVADVCTFQTKVAPDEMFERLKPFKDRVAEDIREDSD